MTTEVPQYIISSNTVKNETNDNADIGSVSVISESDVDNSGTDTKIEDERKPIVCDFCGRVFKYNSHFVIHRRYHTGERPFACNVCNKKFVSNGCLRKHNAVHSEKSFVCSTCNCAFKSDRALRKHNAVHSEVKAHKCDVCNRCFRFRETLTVHKAVHSDVRPFVCVLCNSTFKLRSSLLKHNITHTKEKRFSCKICSEKFLYRSTWERHMRVHTGEKPYACEVCGKNFYQNSALKSHLRVHIGQIKARDICTKCNRYWPVSCIKDHITVCLGTRQYSCKVCGKVFYQSSSLKRHLRVHIEKKTVKVLCTKCNRNWPVSCIKDHITVCIGSNTIS